MVYSKDPDYSWKDFFKELGKVIYEYSDRRDEFSAIVMDIVDRLFTKKPKLPTKFSPFSAMALINRGNRDEFRIKLCEAYKEAFSLEHPVPSGFSGVPMVMPNMWWFIREHNNGEKLPAETIEKDWNALWDNYSILYESHQNKDQESFNSVISQLLRFKGIGIQYLAMFLFWIDSDDYMTFDSNVLDYLKEKKIGVPPFGSNSFYKKKIDSMGIIYLNAIEDIKQNPELPELCVISHESYLNSIVNDFPAIHLSIDQWDSIFQSGIILTEVKELFNLVLDSDVQNPAIKDLADAMGIGKKELVNLIRDSGKAVEKEIETPIDNWAGCAFFEVHKKSPSARLENSQITMSTELVDYLNQEGDPLNNDIEKSQPYKPYLNTILYGPPGTGKTYSTKREAVKIILCKDGISDDEFDQIYGDQIKKKYDEFVSSNRIQFVTFHQSYGYEQFVEGIWPVIEEGDESKQPTYEYKDGIFKEFCDNATPLNLKDVKISETPTVWKVSLKSTGPNEIRQDCLDHGYIRIGWHEYGENVTDDTDYSQYGGKAVLNYFMYEMKEGDIVLSCYSNKTIDAIGVVTGDYYWQQEKKDNSGYYRYRPVKWIKKFDEPYNILEINGGKTMVLATVYKLNRISKAKVFEILKETINLKTAQTNDEKRYVFIIDEINRGNVSRIFGELITLIEESKRKGEPDCVDITLPYTKTRFSIPNNVYIIGTMNTADRSLVALDTALRRRFHFKEMMPRSKLLKTTSDGIDLAAMLDTINERIVAVYDREHQIGHTYLLNKKDVNDVARAFQYDIIPLLQEYFHEDYKKIAFILSKFDAKDDESDFIKLEKRPIKGIEYPRYEVVLPTPIDVNSYRHLYTKVNNDDDNSN